MWVPRPFNKNPEPAARQTMVSTEKVPLLNPSLSTPPPPDVLKDDAPGARHVNRLLIKTRMTLNLQYGTNAIRWRWLGSVHTSDATNNVTFAVACGRCKVADKYSAAFPPRARFSHQCPTFSSSANDSIHNLLASPLRLPLSARISHVVQ